MKNMKKVIAACMAGAFLMTAVPVVSDTMISTAYAAKGGAKFSAPKAAPKAPAPSAKPNTSKASGPNQKDYAPSKNAKELNPNAPGAKAGTNAAAANTGTSRLGNMMRNIGLLAGGMMLGGLLASLLGMEGMGDILGILMNVGLALVAFMVIRWLWAKFTNKGKQENPYSSYQSAMSQQPREKIVDITPPSGRKQNAVPDIKPMAGDYDPKRTADRYRNR